MRTSLNVIEDFSLQNLLLLSCCESKLVACQYFLDHGAKRFRGCMTAVETRKESFSKLHALKVAVWSSLGGLVAGRAAGAPLGQHQYLQLSTPTRIVRRTAKKTYRKRSRQSIAFPSPQSSKSHISLIRPSLVLHLWTQTTQKPSGADIQSFLVRKEWPCESRPPLHVQRTPGSNKALR